MSALTANVRHAAAKQTLSLPFRVPPQDWFSIKQMAALRGMKDTFIEEVYDAGHDLSGHNHNSKGAVKGKRMTKRIPRVWAISYMIKTADYTDESLCDALISTLPHLPPETLMRISNEARKLAMEGSQR